MLLLERNPQAGIKILISGGGHCNVTTSLPPREAARHFGPEAARALRHALRATPPQRIREWLHDEGVATYEAEFEKVWPDSMRARDVRDALVRRLQRSGAELRFGVRVRDLRRIAEGYELLTEGGEGLRAPRVILATGGLSYPKTGTVGDGFAMLEALGVPLRSPVPALAPLASDAAWVHELAGLTLTDCEVQLREASGRILWRRARPLLFTHRGVSGPGAMDASGRLEREPGRYRFCVDLLPGRGEDELRALLFEGPGTLAPRLRGLGLPKRLARSLLARLELDQQGAAQVGAPQRRRLVQELRGLEIPIRGSLGFEQAEVTSGGVPLDALEPDTLQLRALPGLHVVGELLDADGPIGGFSFWLAFATGALAGRAAARSLGRGTAPENPPSDT